MSGALPTPAPNPSTAMARAIVDELVRAHVGHAVLAPGSRSAALAYALHDHPAIRVHIHPDERSAAFVALGIGRASGTPAVVVTTSGSAVANLHPAVIEADLDQIPLILLTADRPVELRSTGANQAIEQVGLFGAALRWSFDLSAAEDRADGPRTWRTVAARAVAASLGAAGPAGPAGPVQLNVGFREPTVPVTDDGRSPAAPWIHHDPGRAGGAPAASVSAGVATPDAATLAALVDTVTSNGQARPGVVVVGQTRQPLADVLNLAEQLGWPVLAEPTGNVRSDARVISHGHQICAHRGFATSHQPQVVLRIGRATLSPAIDAITAVAHQVLIDTYGTWNDPDRRLAWIVAAQPQVVARMLADELRAREATPVAPTWLGDWCRAQQIATQAIDDELGLGGNSGPDTLVPLTEPTLARVLPQVLPSGTVVVAASSMPIRDLDRFLGVGAELTIDANRGAAGIDGFVASMLGVRLAVDARRPVVGIAGDLASLHDINGWLLSEDASVAAASTTLIVVDNNGGGIFSFLPQADHPQAFERLFGTPHGRDFARVAALHDLGYHRVDTVGQLSDALATTSAAAGRHLVHVTTDRTDNRAVHRAVDGAVSDRLSREW